MSLNEEDYRRLLAFRTGVRRFLKWSERQARAAGLTPKQHQLLLAVRGHDDPRGPTIKEASEYMLLRHNSTVELVDRAEAGGFLKREQSTGDKRVVRLKLTPLVRRKEVRRDLSRRASGAHAQRASSGVPRWHPRCPFIG